MIMLKIIQVPNAVLSKRAKSINNIDKSTHRLIKLMEEALIMASDPEGVGLAAPQVGKSLQLFLIRQTPRSPTLVFINPIIEEFKDLPLEKKESTFARATADKRGKDEKGKGVQLEGCLSLYSIWGDVKRHPAVVLSYSDESGKKHRRQFNGFIAIIIQHEFDHLQGILFPKRVLEQKRQLYRSKRNEKNETEFEAIEI